MSDAETTVANAVQELADDSRDLVRAEVDSARRELMERLSAAAPGGILAAAAAGMGMLAVASAHHMSLRVLQRWLGPVGAAFAATTLYTAGAVAAAVGAFRLLADAPAPWPANTARQTAEAAESASRR